MPNITNQNRRRLLSLALAAGFSSCLPSIATAVDKATTGTELTDGASWVGGIAPGTLDSAVWTATSLTGAQNVGAPVTWDSLSFANTTPLSFNGSQITLAGATLGGSFDVIKNVSAAGTRTIVNDLVLTGISSNATISPGNTSARTQFYATGTGTLTLGNVSAAGSAAVNDVNLTIRGTGTGVINGTLNIDGQVFKGDGGTWILNSSNTIGWFAINNGATLAGNNGAYGAGTIYSAGSSTLGSADATPRTFANTLDLATVSNTGTASFGQTTGGTGELTFTGNVLLGSVARNIATNVNTTFSGPITSTNATAFTKSGLANLLLTGNLSGITGAIAVSAGTLTLNPSTAHTGGITLNANGTLSLVNNTAHGTSNVITFNGGTIASSDATPRTISNNFVYTNLSNFGQTSGGTGALTLTGNLDLGGSARSFVTNVPTTVNGNVTNAGTGNLTKAGASDLTLAGTANALPTIIVNAGTVFVPGNITNAGDFTKGGVSSLVLTGNMSGITGNMIVSDGTLTVNPSALHSGGYTLTGGALTLVNNTAHGVGKTLTFNGGGVASTDATARTISNPLAFTGNAVFGQTAVGTGALTVTSNADLGGVTRTFTVNADTTFSGNITTSANGLTKNGPGNLTLAGNANSIPGTITAGGGTLTLATANTFAGNITANSGILAAGNNGAFGTATLRFGGGTIASSDSTARTFSTGKTIDFAVGSSLGTATTGNLIFTDTINLGGGQKTATINNTLTEFSGTLNSSASTNSFDKAGLGTLILSGTSTISNRPVNVTAGKLLVNGSLTSGGTTTVNGGTLGGTGTITAAVLVNGTGTLAPGASIESLTAASLTMVSGSTFGWEAANTSATGADLLTVTGALSLTDVGLGLDAATLAALSSNTWSPNDKLTLINYGGTAVTSGFFGYTDDTEYNFGLNSWRINYNDSTGGANYSSEATAANFITLTYVSAVPEPGTVALGVLAAAFGSTLYLRRRRIAN